MKRLALATLLSLIVSLAAVADPGPEPDQELIQPTEACVRLRSGAAGGRGVVDCLEAGTQLRVLGTKASWTHVRLQDGTEGWVDSALLQPAIGAVATTPAEPSEPLAGTRQDLEGQIIALEGQLGALAALREATDQRLRDTIALAEAAQNETARLRQRVEELDTQPGDNGDPAPPNAEAAALAARNRGLEEALAAAESRVLRAAGMNAEQERRIEALDTSLSAGRAREEEQRQALAAAAVRSSDAERLDAERRARIAELESALSAAETAQAASQSESPPEPPRRAELKRRLEEARARLREAEQTNSRQAERIVELEQQLAVALQTAEQQAGEQAQRITELESQLADSEVRIAEAELKARLGGRQEAAPQAPTGPLVKVRSPIVASQEPPAAEVQAPPEVTEEAPPAASSADEPALGTDGALDTVRAWAAAWSDQRVDDYLSFYAAGFQPPDGLGRALWEEQRRQRLSRPSFIRVTLSELSARAAADGAVTVSFRQEYESESFADAVAKELTLVEEDGTWLLLEERATP